MDKAFLQHSATFAEQLRVDFDINYDLEGIQTIEHTINENRAHYEQKSEKERIQLACKIGFFIGVCMIKNYGGEWIEHEQGYGIKVNDYQAFPINKAFKFISEDGMFDSISSFYEISGSLEAIMAKNVSSAVEEDPKTEAIQTKNQHKAWWQFWKK